jgi:hypothetical protein
MIMDNGAIEVLSSGMYCHVVQPMLTDVSEVRTASIIREMSEPRKSKSRYD